MNERLYIKEMLEDLNYRDRRSIRRWCFNQNLRLIKDKGTNRLYVLKNEYEFAKRRNYPKSNPFFQYQETAKRIELTYEPEFENEKRMLSILMGN